MTDRKPISDIVKDPGWQKVRQDLVGKWASDPIGCCKKVQQWLGNVRTASNDELRIVMNYLTGTGFRTGRIKHACISKIRGAVSAEMKRRKIEGKWYD